MNKHVSAALYTRESSDQQAKNKNVESQIELLEERIDQDGLSYAEGMAFIDAGVSGATLIRPELEKLRDRVSFGLIESIFFHRIVCLANTRIKFYCLKNFPMPEPKLFFSIMPSAQRRKKSYCCRWKA